MESSKARGQGHRRSTQSGASAKRSKPMACSGAGGGGVLQAKWLGSMVKLSSGVEGEAVEATTCSRGEAVEGVLRRRNMLRALAASKT
jgi:hypothetical protein